MANAEYRTDRLMQNIGVSALFLGLLYMIVAFLVWRGVKRVFRETPIWNTLKVFCLSLIIVPSLRASSFIVHFLIYEGEILGKDTAQFLKDLIMNSLYIIPTTIFMCTYMVLICIWIEMTLFSRDQYLIRHDSYNRVWKYVWSTVILLILSALIFVFVYASYTGNLDFITALYTSLWIMTFFIPLFAFFIWVLLIIRFAGFPYLNHVWKQQTIRMFYVVLVWTIGQLIIGVMTAVWTSNEGDWMNQDDYIWFSLSVALCLLFSEIFPLIYTSDWHRMGFLLMAFVNWRDLWLRNERHALAHDPRLIDDLFDADLKLSHSLALEFKPFRNVSKQFHSNYNSLGHNLLVYDNKSLSFEEPIANSNKASSQRKNVDMRKEKIKIEDVMIDDSLIIPTYVHKKYNPYYTTHRARLRTDYERKKMEYSQEGIEHMEFCLKVFECDAVEKSLLQPIYDNLLKLKKLERDGLGSIYDIKLKLAVGGSKKMEILSRWYHGGSLFDIIDMSPKDTPFAEHVIKRIIVQIATFMDWLHTECKIPHGHLKSRNILFDNEMNVCITDLGLISLKKTMSVLLPNSNFEGYWMDKEYFSLGKSITQECDVWAFGFILYEIIAKQQAFYGQRLDYIKKCIVNNKNLPVLPPHCTPFLSKLIEECWNVERSKRPTFHQIVERIQAEMSA